MTNYDKFNNAIDKLRANWPEIGSDIFRKHKLKFNETLSRLGKPEILSRMEWLQRVEAREVLKIGAMHEIVRLISQGKGYGRFAETSINLNANFFIWDGISVVSLDEEDLDNYLYNNVDESELLFEFARSGDEVYEAVIRTVQDYKKEAM